MLVTSANPPTPSTRGGEDPVGWSLVHNNGHNAGVRGSVIGQPPSAYQWGDVGKLDTKEAIMIIVKSNAEHLTTRYNQFVGADDRI